MLAAEKEKWQAAEERIRQLEMTNNLLAEYLNTQAQTIYLNEQNAARQNEIHAEEKQNMFAAVQALLAERKQIAEELAEERKQSAEELAEERKQSAEERKQSAEERKQIAEELAEEQKQSAEDRKHLYEQIQRMDARLTEAKLLLAAAVNRNGVN